MSNQNQIVWAVALLTIVSSYVTAIAQTHPHRRVSPFISEPSPGEDLGIDAFFAYRNLPAMESGLLGEGLVQGVLDELQWKQWVNQQVRPSAVAARIYDPNVHPASYGQVQQFAPPKPVEPENLKKFAALPHRPLQSELPSQARLQSHLPSEPTQPNPHRPLAAAVSLVTPEGVDKNDVANRPASKQPPIQTPAAAVPAPASGVPAEAQAASPDSPPADAAAAPLETAPAAAAPVAAPVGPNLPDGFRLHVPISEQEIGDLVIKIKAEKNLIEKSKEDANEELDRRLAQLEESHQRLSSAQNLLFKDVAQQHKIANFQQEKERIEQQLNNIPEPKAPPAEDAEQLFATLDSLRTNLAALNDQLLEVRKSQTYSKSRLKQIPDDRMQAKNDLSKWRKRLEEEELGDADVNTLIQLRARELELEYQIRVYDSEVRLHKNEGRLLPLERDYLQQTIEVLKKEINAWNFAANERQRLDIAREVREAREKKVDAAPVLKELAGKNVQLTERRAGLAGKITAAREEDLTIKAQLNVVKTQHAKVKKHLVDGDANAADGILLIGIRRKVNRPFKSFARIREIKKELQMLNLMRLDINECRQSLASPSQYVDRLLVANPRSDNNQNGGLTDEELQTMATELVNDVRDQYDELSNDYDDYVELLGVILSDHESLITEIEATLAPIDEKVIWVRSAQPLGIAQIQKAQRDVSDFFSSAEWFELGNGLRERIQGKPHESAVSIFGLALLFIIGRRFKA